MSATDPQPISLFELDDVAEPRRLRSAKRRSAPPALAAPEPEPPAAPAAVDAALPLLLTMVEAAAVLRIGRTTIYKLAELHRSSHGASGLPTVRIGNKLFVRRADLSRILDGPNDAA